MSRKFYERGDLYISRELIHSDAFRDLSGKAALLCLLRLHQKARRKKIRGKKAVKEMVITNNNELEFTSAEAKELGMSESSFRKAIKELVEDKGFINIAVRGSWYYRTSTLYGISNRWRQYGTPSFKKETVDRKMPEKIGFQKGNKRGRKK